MTLLSAIIFLALFVAFIAGVAYLCCRIRDCFNRIDQNQKKRDKEAGEFIGQLSVEDQVTVSNILNSVEVTGTAAVYFRVGATDPAVAGTGSYVVPAAVGSRVELDVTTAGATQVRLISSGTPSVSIRGVVDTFGR